MAWRRHHLLLSNKTFTSLHGLAHSWRSQVARKLRESPIYMSELMASSTYYDTQSKERLSPVRL